MTGRTYSLRQIILALVIIGMLGLEAELILLKHVDSFTQWIPLVVIGAGLASAFLLVARPRRATMRTFQVIMAAFVVAGVAGLFFHFKGNVEFALERDPQLSGLRLVWKSLRGATPSLAPGALAQLGLLGLAYTYRNPLWSDTGDKAADPSPGTTRPLHS